MREGGSAREGEIERDCKRAREIHVERFRKLITREHERACEREREGLPKRARGITYERERDRLCETTHARERGELRERGIVGEREREGGIARESDCERSSE